MQIIVAILGREKPVNELRDIIHLDLIINSRFISNLDEANRFFEETLKNTFICYAIEGDIYDISELLPLFKTYPRCENYQLDTIITAYNITTKQAKSLTIPPKLFDSVLNQIIIDDDVDTLSNLMAQGFQIPLLVRCIDDYNHEEYVKPLSLMRYSCSNKILKYLGYI